ncbi:MAG: DnaJ domain-containing protein [Armatimonadetes bacterium]|nr:DnaJ domain-containing protein [Armatimonadota bacterium]
MTTSAPTHYEVLGVGSSADSETIRKAYRRLAQKHHPDVSDSPDAHEDMARINEAFETLIDQARREEYDAILAGAVRETVQKHSPKNPVRIKLMRRLYGHKTPVYAVSFAPDSGALISVGFDNEVIWWNDGGQRSRQTKLESGNISTLKAFAEDRVVAAGSSDSQVNVWCLENDQVTTWKGVHEEWVSCLAISGDGNAVASGSIHHHLRVCDSTTGSARFSLRTEDASVTAVAFSPDGRFLASGTANAKVAIREARSGKWLRSIDKIRSVVTAIAFSTDNRYLAVAGVDLSIRVFNLDTGELVKMLYGHGRPIESIAFHPNGWLFASASRDGTIGLWNAAKGIGNVRLEVSSRPISCVTFSADGTKLAVSGQDRIVRLFEVTAKAS